MEDISTKSISILSLVTDIIDNKKYNFNLPIQRRGNIWNKNENSLFIDSIIRLYPIYPALLNKHSDTKILDVVDFKQRFMCILSYVNNDFSLSRNLKPIVIENKEYEIAGKKFKNLDKIVQNRFYSRDLTVITMIDATDEEINEIFDRINMGHPLTNGHKRSTIENNELREVIYKLADHPFLKKTFTKSHRKRNIDRDIVIQILMLSEVNKEYDFGSFRNQDMNKFIIYYNNMLLNESTKEIVLSKIKMINKGLDILNTEFQDFETIKIKPTTIPFVCYGIYRIIKDNKSSENYLKWLHEFLNTYTENQEYLQYCNGSGTAGSEMVKGRLDYFKKIIKEL